MPPLAPLFVLRMNSTCGQFLHAAPLNLTTFLRPRSKGISISTLLYMFIMESETITQGSIISSLLRSYPANMLAVTVRPTQKGANGERVWPLMAAMHTTMVRKMVNITSARVAAARSLLVTSKAPPRLASDTLRGNTP